MYIYNELSDFMYVTTYTKETQTTHTKEKEQTNKQRKKQRNKKDRLPT